jgi:hypothetical protein
MARRKAYSIRRDKVAGPPQGEPWCWLSRELLQSPAWKRRSIHCARLIDFLMIEHMSHAGLENGNLAAPWRQLAEHGISRRYIKAAIAEALALKLITVHSGGRRATGEASMSRYGLTFYATRVKNADGNEYWVPPTDAWKRVSDSAAQAYFASRPAWNGAPDKDFAGPHRETGNGSTVKPGGT